MTQGLVMACLLHIPPADYSTITNKTSPPFAEALGVPVTESARRIPARDGSAESGTEIPGRPRTQDGELASLGRHRQRLDGMAAGLIP